MGYIHKHFRLSDIKPKLSFIKTEDNPAIDSRTMIYVCSAGFILGYLLFIDSPNKAAIAAISSIVFYFLYKTWIQATENKITELKKKECGVLFETVEILMRSGQPLVKALSSSENMLVYLRPAVQKSIMSWNLGSDKALEVLRKEINLPEGDILISLLQQLNQIGINNFDGIIQREAQRLEELQRTAEKIKIGKTPYLLIFFRILPISVIFGGFAGGLYMRLYEVLPFLGGGMPLP